MIRNKCNLAEIFSIIRNNVFEMSLLEFENLLNLNSDEQICSYSKWQRFEKGEFGVSFKDKPLRLIEFWSDLVVTAIKNTKFLNNVSSQIINYNKKLYLELVNTLNNSSYSKISYEYSFENINISNLEDLTRFVTCVFIIFSDNHGKYFAGNDHNPTSIVHNIKAPFISKVGVRIVNPAYLDVTISSFDFRFISPNTRMLPSDAVHTLEHCFSNHIRKSTRDLIDVSIMGCRTGFLMYFAGDKDIGEIEELFINALNDILEFDEIPKATPDVCWSYQNHNLESAKYWVRKFLAEYSTVKN